MKTRIFGDLSGVYLCALYNIRSAGKHRSMTIGIRSGTMVVTLPTRDGLVVVADKRVTEHNSVLGNSIDDTKTKIVRVSDRVGLFGLHTAELVDASSRESELNLYESVVAVAHQNATTDPRTLSILIMNKMTEEFSAFLQRIPTSSWPRTTFNNEEEPVFYEVVIFFLDESGDSKLLGAQLRYRQETGEVGGHPKPYPSGPYVFGGLHTCVELIKGNEPEFDNYRSEPLMRQCVGALQGRRLDTESAIRYAKRLIEIASAHEKGISATSDCAVLLKGGGSKWPLSCAKLDTAQVEESS